MMKPASTGALPRPDDVTSVTGYPHRKQGVQSTKSQAKRQEKLYYKDCRTKLIRVDFIIPSQVYSTGVLIRIDGITVRFPLLLDDLP